jgi:hypothetical protein
LCRVSNWNCSQECLTSAEALDALLELRTTNPTLHAALNQGDDNIAQLANIEEKPFQDTEVYDDCDIPLDVVSDLLMAGGSAVGTNFSVDGNHCIPGQAGFLGSQNSKCEIYFPLRCTTKLRRLPETTA